ncbi:MAG: phosphatase PAP2 family protein [Actinomycetaceae bacterium]|nr:phosphatase PAP2 family protein [Actinomycetaceae bacterium]
MQFPSKKGFWGPPLILAVMLLTGFLIKAAQLYKTEIEVSIWLTENQSSVPSALSWLVAYGFAPGPAVLITLLIAFGIWLIRRDLEWLHFILITLFGWLAAALIKPLVDRARPDASLLTTPIHPQDNFLSFPSGHTAFSAGLFGAIVLVLVARENRKLGFALAALGVILVGFARVYAGAHYPSDTMAGAISGAAGVWFGETLWQYWRAKHALEVKRTTDGTNTASAEPNPMEARNARDYSTGHALADGSNNEQTGRGGPKTGTLSADEK